MIIFEDAERWYVDVGNETRVIDDGRRLSRLRAELTDALKNSATMIHDGLGAGTRAALHQASLVEPVAAAASARPHRDEPTASVKRVVRPLATISIGDALAQRGSTRNLLPPTAEDIITLLFHSARVRTYWSGADGFTATSRPSPSAGARHPLGLSVVVGRSVDLEPGVYSFDPVRCELRCVSQDSRGVSQLLERARSLSGQSEAPPVVIYLFADLARTLSRYPLGISLLFRDAGALAATISLAAIATGLGTCLLASACTIELNEMYGQPFPSFAELGSIAVGRFNAVGD